MLCEGKLLEDIIEMVVGACKQLHETNYYWTSELRPPTQGTESWTSPNFKNLSHFDVKFYCDLQTCIMYGMNVFRFGMNKWMNVLLGAEKII